MEALILLNKSAYILMPFCYCFNLLFSPPASDPKVPAEQFITNQIMYSSPEGIEEMPLPLSVQYAAEHERKVCTRNLIKKQEQFFKISWKQIGN